MKAKSHPRRSRTRRVVLTHKPIVIQTIGKRLTLIAENSVLRRELPLELVQTASNRWIGGAR